MSVRVFKRVFFKTPFHLTSFLIPEILKTNITLCRHYKSRHEKWKMYCPKEAFWKFTTCTGQNPLQRETHDIINFKDNSNKVLKCLHYLIIYLHNLWLYIIIDFMLLTKSRIIFDYFDSCFIPTSQFNQGFFFISGHDNKNGSEQ